MASRPFFNNSKQPPSESSFRDLGNKDMVPAIERKVESLTFYIAQLQPILNKLSFQLENKNCTNDSKVNSLTRKCFTNYYSILSSFREFQQIHDKYLHANPIQKSSNFFVAYSDFIESFLAIFNSSKYLPSMPILSGIFSTFYGIYLGMIIDRPPLVTNEEFKEICDKLKEQTADEKLSEVVLKLDFKQAKIHLSSSKTDQIYQLLPENNQGLFKKAIESLKNDLGRLPLTYEIAESISVNVSIIQSTIIPLLFDSSYNIVYFRDYLLSILNKTESYKAIFNLFKYSQKFIEFIEENQFELCIKPVSDYSAIVSIVEKGLLFTKRVLLMFIGHEKNFIEFIHKIEGVLPQIKGEKMHQSYDDSIRKIGRVLEITEIDYSLTPLISHFKTKAIDVSEKIKQSVNVLNIIIPINLKYIIDAAKMHSVSEEKTKLRNAARKEVFMIFELIKKKEILPEHITFFQLYAQVLKIFLKSFRTNDSNVIEEIIRILSQNQITKDYFYTYLGINQKIKNLKDISIILLNEPKRNYEKTLSVLKINIIDNTVKNVNEYIASMADAEHLSNIFYHAYDSLMDSFSLMKTHKKFMKLANKGDQINLLADKNSSKEVLKISLQITGLMNSLYYNVYEAKQVFIHWIEFTLAGITQIDIEDKKEKLINSLPFIDFSEELLDAEIGLIKFESMALYQYKKKANKAKAQFILESIQQLQSILHTDHILINVKIVSILKPLKKAISTMSTKLLHHHLVESQRLQHMCNYLQMLLQMNKILAGNKTNDCPNIMGNSIFYNRLLIIQKLFNKLSSFFEGTEMLDEIHEILSFFETFPRPKTMIFALPDDSTEEISRLLIKISKFFDHFSTSDFAYQICEKVTAILTILIQDSSKDFREQIQKLSKINEITQDIQTVASYQEAFNLFYRIMNIVDKIDIQSHECTPLIQDLHSMTRNLMILISIPFYVDCFRLMFLKLLPDAVYKFEIKEDLEIVEIKQIKTLDIENNVENVIHTTNRIKKKLEDISYHHKDLNILPSALPLFEHVADIIKHLINSKNAFKEEHEKMEERIKKLNSALEEASKYQNTTREEGSTNYHFSQKYSLMINSIKRIYTNSIVIQSIKQRIADYEKSLTNKSEIAEEPKETPVEPKKFSETSQRAKQVHQYFQEITSDENKIAKQNPIALRSQLDRINKKINDLADRIKKIEKTRTRNQEAEVELIYLKNTKNMTSDLETSDEQEIAAIKKVIASVEESIAQLKKKESSIVTNEPELLLDFLKTKRYKNLSEGAIDIASFNGFISSTEMRIQALQEMNKEES